MNNQNTDQKIVDEEKTIVTSLTNSKDIELNNVGWTSRVYIIEDGRFVVKFPRTEIVKKEYEQEIKILKLLENLSNKVQVPKIRWIGDNLDYLGYEGIIGQTFDTIIDNLNSIEKVDLGRQIGSFLTQLHSLKLNDAPVFSMQYEISQFQNSYQTVLPTIKTYFTNEEQSKLKAFMLEDMPAAITKLGSDTTLCHGDLGYWNLIISDNNKVGIIDWGDIGYYDKSKDFLGLEDQEILDSALSTYGVNDNLKQKILIRQKALPFLDLSYFVKNNIENKINETLLKIHNNF